MNRWDAEPLWQTHARLQAEVAPQVIRASDTLTVALTEEARVTVSQRRGYRGLDMLKSRLTQGERNVIIRLR